MKILIASFVLLGLVGIRAILAGDGIDIASIANRELDLSVSLLNRTNATSDRILAELIGKNGIANVDIKQVTLVFYYPKREDVLPSYTEMAGGLRLIGRVGRVERRDTKDEFPMSFIRLHDSRRTNVMCDVELLGSMSVGDASTNQLTGKIFLRYDFREAWVEDRGKRRLIPIE